MLGIGKKQLIMGIVFLLLLSPSLAYFNNQEVDDLRDHVFLLLNFANSSIAPNQTNSFIVHNPDKRQMFLSMQLIPLPLYEDCYIGRTSCDMSLWETTFNILYNGNMLIGDTASCWDWWVTSGGSDMLFEREENKTLCSVVSIPFTPEDESFNVSFVLSPRNTSKALPSLNVRVFDYSTAYSDKQQKFSSTADTSLNNVGTLIILNKNVWQLVYYTVLITLIIVGALVVVGGIPIAFKWIITKARGD